MLEDEVAPSNAFVRSVAANHDYEPCWTQVASGDSPFTASQIYRSDNGSGFAHETQLMRLSK